MIVNQTGIKITATIASNSEPVTILKYKINEPINSPIFAIQVRKVRLFNFGRVRIGARPYGTYWGGFQIEASNSGFDWPRNDIPIGLERNWASLSLKAYLRKKFGLVLFFRNRYDPSWQRVWLCTGSFKETSLWHLPIDYSVKRNFHRSPSKPNRSLGIIVCVVNFEIKCSLWFPQVHIKITVGFTIWFKHNS